MILYDAGIIVKEIINSIPNNTLPTNFKTRVYPLVAPVGTTFPFAVYRRTSGQYAYSDKDYDKNESVYMQIKLMTQTYEQSIDLINKISDAFVNFRNIFINNSNQELANVDNINITESYEEFYDDTFIQTISIEMIFK